MRVQFTRVSSMVPRPYHQQIEDQIRTRIDTGEWAPGTCLPGSGPGAEQLGVSRSTLIKVYERLRSLGVLTAHPGRGTVVAQDARAKVGN